MADLMTDTYTYEALANKYGNFYVPAMRLYVNGQDITETMGIAVVDAEISLSLSAASTAVLRISESYNRAKREFDKNIKNKFKLGTIVEVGVGYGSEIRKILKGFVAVLGAEFTDLPCFVVTIMDVRRLMMISGIHHVLHNVENYSDAVKTILENYSKLCTAEIDATNDKLKSPVSQNATDYDFITKELVANGRTGREFFVLLDKVYFRKPRKETRPVMTVELGRELSSFQTEASYVNVEIQISGYNQQEQKTITASALAKSGEPQTSLSSKTPVSCISDLDADTQEKANIRAQALAGVQLAEGQRGKGSSIGLPEIVPGRFIEVVKVEEMVNKKFYVTSVTHRLGEDHFTTEFETGGWI